MCIGSNSVNQAQDLMTVTKIEDLPNSLLPNVQRYYLCYLNLSGYSLESCLKV